MTSLVLSYYIRMEFKNIGQTWLFTSGIYKSTIVYIRQIYNLCLSASYGANLIGFLDVKW